MRILPRINEQVNEEWISDKTRFVWDGLRTQRLDRPYVRRNGKLTPASWADAFAAIRDAVSAAPANRIGAIAGDLASVEEMYALKLLMQSLGSENIDCRQDGAALDPALGRASYIFNPTIEGIEQADAILIIGSDPRFEASCSTPASASGTGWATARSASSATLATCAIPMKSLALAPSS